MAVGKILVVDDEDALRSSIAELLRLQDFDVLEASSGQEALAIIDLEPNIAFVISDIRMPNGDGIFLLDELRRRHPEIPVILLLTGHTEYSQKAVKVRGAIDMLSKPPDFNLITMYLNQCSALFGT